MLIVGVVVVVILVLLVLHFAIFSKTKEWESTLRDIFNWLILLGAAAGVIALMGAGMHAGIIGILIAAVGALWLIGWGKTLKPKAKEPQAKEQYSAKYSQAQTPHYKTEDVKSEQKAQTPRPQKDWHYFAKKGVYGAVKAAHTGKKVFDTLKIDVKEAWKDAGKKER
jgi:hypothetical protein